MTPIPPIPKPVTKNGLKFTFKFGHWGLYVSKITNKQGQIFIFHVGEQKYLWDKDNKCYVSTDTQHQLYHTDIENLT